MSKLVKVAVAVAVVGVYVFVPAYRYWAIGSYIGYKIVSDKPRPPVTVRKESSAYKRIMGGAKV